MGPRPAKHSLERKDNNGNYEPLNCVWATAKQQNNNRRSSRFIEFNGERRTLIQWAEHLGLKYSVLKTRLYLNWPLERVLTNTTRDWNELPSFELCGQTLTIGEWAIKTGIHYQTLKGRLLRHHWPVEKALTTPARKKAAKGRR